MKRTAGLVLVLLAGCSTAPCADLLDAWKPGHVEPGSVYGGVCNGPGCQPTAPETTFATGPANPVPIVSAVGPTAKPTVETVAAPAIAPATGSWKRMMPATDTAPKPLPAASP